MPEHTPLETALVEACAFALAHGVGENTCSIEPADFGIQRSAIGLTTATYVDANHAVTVMVDRHGRTTIGVAELDWVHWPNPDYDGDEDCEVCHPDNAEPAQYRGVSLTNVHLPGDAPVSEPANA